MDCGVLQRVPKVSQDYLDGRRAEILDAAIVCFFRDGFHPTSMKDIVRQSGLSPGAICNYFRSKEEIIEAIAARRQQREKQFVEEAIKEGSAEEALHRLRDAFLDELGDTKERMCRRVSVQLWAEAQRNPKVSEVVKHSFAEPAKLISDLIAEGQSRGEVAAWVDADTVASFVIAVFHGLVLQNEWSEKFSAEPHKVLLDILLKAIAPNDVSLARGLGRKQGRPSRTGKTRSVSKATGGVA